MSEPLTEWNRTPIPNLSALSAAFNTSMLLPLYEVNETVLNVLAAEAHGDSSETSIDIVNGLRDLWRGLNGEAIKRAAQCPVLLLDFNAWTLNAEANEFKQNHPKGWCPRPIAVSLTRSAVMLAWHLCRTNRQIAGIRLGLTPTKTQALKDLRLQQIENLAEAQCHVLQPRWEHRLDFWRNLLVAANMDCPRALDEAHLEGLHLLVSELVPQTSERRGHSANNDRNPTNALSWVGKPA